LDLVVRFTFGLATDPLILSGGSLRSAPSALRSSARLEGYGAKRDSI
jgi:hypothetical protein